MQVVERGSLLHHLGHARCLSRRRGVALLAVSSGALCVNDHAMPSVVCGSHHLVEQHISLHTTLRRLRPSDLTGFGGIYFSMDPATVEQLDFGEEEYDGNHKLQYPQGGAIPALADEEMIGDEDEYDDLYNDVNVGEGFLQMQRSESQIPSAPVNNEFQTSKNSQTRADALPSKDTNNALVANAAKFSEQKTSMPIKQTVERETLPETAQNSQSGNLGGGYTYRGSAGVPHNTAPDLVNSSEKVPPPNVATSDRPVDSEYLIRSSVENGNTMLFVGELHWWTTDTELESVLIHYGKVKEIKFFDERASGKSKGYCQVEFYDACAASACKEGMNGHVFNGRPCVVAFATPQTIRQMGASYMNKNQAQAQYQPQQGRNPPHDGTGGRGGDSGRNFGRGGGWGRGNQLNNRGPGAGPMRGGRGGGMGNRNMMGNNNNAPNAGNFGQGLNGPGFCGPAGLMHPQGMMGPGFDLAFMGRGAGGGYGGFSSPAFPGMLPPFQGVNVAPHVNPAFFGRGMSQSGMGMMGNVGGMMGGPHSGMWNDGGNNMGGWGGMEHGRESSYGGEDNASEYGYGEVSHDKGVREKERNSDRDWPSNNPEKRHREEKERDDGERYDRESRYREEKDHYRDYRHKDRDSGYDDDWDRGQSSRSRSRSGAAVVQEDDHRRSRSRDADNGRRRPCCVVPGFDEVSTPLVVDAVKNRFVLLFYFKI
ncbi:RNA-binding protein [Striga asiatica]|uniref:RNA-binding protein n=1 Tax=Striga asiatica TaxID=4170 RepID=A0A5A7NXY5_STRAF|nr:RNA-binding protein [Striga asiatica]